MAIQLFLLFTASAFLACAVLSILAVVAELTEG